MDDYDVRLGVVLVVFGTVLIWLIVAAIPRG